MKTLTDIELAKEIVIASLDSRYRKTWKEDYFEDMVRIKLQDDKDQLYEYVKVFSDIFNNARKELENDKNGKMG